MQAARQECRGRQQFSDPEEEERAASGSWPRPYTYHAPPEISRLSPTSGPVVGATRIVLSGAHLSRGHAPTCRFPRAGGGVGRSDLVVNASRVTDGAGAALVCESPPAAEAEAALAPLELALNGQDYTSSALDFRCSRIFNSAHQPECSSGSASVVVTGDGGHLSVGTTTSPPSVRSAPHAGRLRGRPAST